MKQLIALILVSLSAGAMAQHRPHHHHHGHGGHGWGWVAPALITGAVVYAATRPPAVVQQPVVIQQPTDVVYIDGIAYRRQMMLVNGYYQEVLIRM